MQEFGHDRRETLADVENTDDTTVIDEIGEKTHTEHQHSDQGVLDAEGTAATDADDNWDQRICCTKHNQLCCPTPASLVDDDGNEVETKKVVSLDSAAGKYSSGSEVVKEIKNEERGKFITLCNDFLYSFSVLSCFVYNISLISSI